MSEDGDKMGIIGRSWEEVENNIPESEVMETTIPQIQEFGQSQTHDLHGYS